MNKDAVAQSPSEPIDQSITISDEAHTGNITVIGRLTQITQTRHEWLPLVWASIVAHKTQCIACAVVLIGTALGYYSFVDRYLLSGWLAVSLACLGILVAWYLPKWRQLDLPRQVIVALVGMCIVATLAWQVRVIVRPPTIPEEDFGVVLALLSDSGTYHSSPVARTLTGQTYDLLTQLAYNHNQASQEVLPAAGSKPRQIALARTGVLASPEEAAQVGALRGADLVIWGEVATTGRNQEVVTIRFFVAQPHDAVGKQDFPTVLSIAEPYTEFTIDEVNLAADPVTTKRAVYDYATIFYSFTQGLVAFNNQQFPDAVTNLTTAVHGIDQSTHLNVSDQGRAALYLYIGQALYRLGRIEDGIEWLNDAWTLDQSDPAIPLSLAFGYRSLGQSDELAQNLARVERLLTRLLAVAPHNLRALYDQGLLNEVRGRNDLATYSYQRIVQLDPAFYLAYINLGQTYTELGRFRDAEQTLRSAVQVAEAGNINPSRAWRELGLVLAKLARRADAEAAFRTAINLSPDLPWAYFHYARFLEEQGRFEEALLNFRMVQRTSADTAWTNQELGDFFQRHEMHANAIRYYQQAIMAAPTRALLRVALAKSQYAVGNKSAAWQAFDEAVRLAPDDPYVYAVYGWTLLQSGQRVAAAQKYEEARARDPDNENTLTALARIYQALGNQTGAEPVVCQLVQSDNLFAGEAVRVAEEIRVTMDIDCAATS